MFLVLEWSKYDQIEYVQRLKWDVAPPKYGLDSLVGQIEKENKSGMFLPFHQYLGKVTEQKHSSMD